MIRLVSSAEEAQTGDNAGSSVVSTLPAQEGTRIFYLSGRFHGQRVRAALG